MFRGGAGRLLGGLCWGCRTRCPFLLVLATGTPAPRLRGPWAQTGPAALRAAAWAALCLRPLGPRDTVPVLPVGPESVKHPAAATGRPSTTLCWVCWLLLSLVPACLTPHASSEALSLCPHTPQLSSAAGAPVHTDSVASLEFGWGQSAMVMKETAVPEV